MEIRDYKKDQIKWFNDRAEYLRKRVYTIEKCIEKVDNDTAKELLNDYKCLIIDKIDEYQGLADKWCYIK